MKSARYWKRRHEQWMKAQIKQDERFMRTMRKYYERTADELEKGITKYFNRYGRDGIIEYRTLLQGLSDTDKRLLIEDIDKFIEQYPEYEHLVPIRESVYKLNRLEGLHYSTQLELLELGAIEQKEIERYLREVYGHNFEMLAKELGIGSEFLSINRQIITDTINSRWVNNENFSDRIWQNKSKLLNYINTEYRDGIVRGDNYDKLSQILMKRFELGYNDAKRLVWTESSFVLNQAHSHAYIEAGVTEYVYDAILDHRTSEICRKLDGEAFKFEDAEVGINFPPMHPWCRSTYVGKDVHKLLERQ